MTEKIARLCPDCGSDLAPRAASCACGWRRTRKKTGGSGEHGCAFNDHGFSCQELGAMSVQVMHGPESNWYCAHHYNVLFRGGDERQGVRPAGDWRGDAMREYWRRTMQAGGAMAMLLRASQDTSSPDDVRDLLKALRAQTIGQPLPYDKDRREL